MQKTAHWNFYKRRQAGEGLWFIPKEAVFEPYVTQSIQLGVDAHKKHPWWSKKSLNLK